MISTRSSRWRRLFDESANPADDGACPVAVPDNAVERLPDLIQIRRVGAQPAQRRLGVGDRSGDRLVHFMGDRRRELPHRLDAVGVRQLHLCLTVAPLALASFGFRPLALGQIKHESDTLVSSLFECR